MVLIRTRIAVLWSTRGIVEIGFSALGTPRKGQDMMNFTAEGALFHALRKFFEEQEDKLYAVGVENLSNEYRIAMEMKNKLLHSSPGTQQIEEIMTGMEVISNDVFYRKGFMDGVKTIVKILIL